MHCILRIFSAPLVCFFLWTAPEATAPDGLFRGFVSLFFGVWIGLDGRAPRPTILVDSVAFILLLRAPLPKLHSIRASSHALRPPIPTLLHVARLVVHPRSLRHCLKGYSSHSPTVPEVGLSRENLNSHDTSCGCSTPSAIRGACHGDRDVQERERLPVRQ